MRGGTLQVFLLCGLLLNESVLGKKTCAGQRKKNKCLKFGCNWTGRTALSGACEEPKHDNDMHHEDFLTHDDLEHEIEELEDDFEEERQQLEDDIDDLRDEMEEEVDDVRDDLEDLEDRIDEDGLEALLEPLRAEIKALRKRVDQQDIIIDQLKLNGGGNSGPTGGDEGNGEPGEGTCTRFTDAELLDGHCRGKLRLVGTIGQVEREGVYERNGAVNGKPLWERSYGGDSEPSAIWFEGNLKGTKGDWGVASFPTEDELAEGIKQNLVGITLRSDGQWQEFTSFELLEDDFRFGCVDSEPDAGCGDDCILNADEGAKCPRVELDDLPDAWSELEGVYSWDQDSKRWKGDDNSIIYRSAFGTWNVVRGDSSEDLEAMVSRNLRAVTLDTAGQWAYATGDDAWRDSQVELICECSL